LRPEPEKKEFPVLLAQQQLEMRAGSRAAAWPWPPAAAILIALGAFLLRFWTIEQHLPFVNHPDEPNPINYVIGMLQSGDPNQQFFQKPSLYVYLLLSVLTLHYRLGLAGGLYPGFDQMLITTHLVTTVPGFFIWGRTLTAVIGSLTVLSAYGYGQRLWSAGAGLTAALFVALLPFHLQFSQYVTTDVTASWFVLLAVTFATMVAREGRWQAYLVAGAFAGFAASTKYNHGLAALPIVLAHLLHWRGAWLRRFPRLVGAGLAAIGTFVIGTPYAVLRFNQVREGMFRQWGNYGGGNGHFQGAWNIAGYGQLFWHDVLGPLLCLAVLAGLVLLRRRERAAALVWLAFVLPSLLLHLSRPTHFNQNMLPVLVLCALPVGISVAAGGQWAGQRGRAAQVAAALLLGGALLLPAAGQSWQYVSRQARGDARVQAMAWLDAHLAPGERVAADIKQIPHAQESRWSVLSDDYPRELAWYRRQGYRYLVLSDELWQEIVVRDPSAAGQVPLAAFNRPTAPPMLGPQLSIYATGLDETVPPQTPSAEIVMGGARLLGISTVASHLNPERPETTVGETFRPGSFAGIRTFWQVAAPFERDYFIFVHVLDAAGNIVTQRDAPPWQGRFPTSSWQPGSLVVDFNDVPLPATLPPGEYQVRVGMFDPVNGGHPPLRVNGRPVDAGGLVVGTIRVAP
jgi:4-amino-4-deoxy-L-arabinose transferase-like glycosyltransferase